MISVTNFQIQSIRHLIACSRVDAFVFFVSVALQCGQIFSSARWCGQVGYSEMINKICELSLMKPSASNSKFMGSKLGQLMLSIWYTLVAVITKPLSQGENIPIDLLTSLQELANARVL